MLFFLHGFLALLSAGKVRSNFLLDCFFLEAPQQYAQKGKRSRLGNFLKRVDISTIGLRTSTVMRKNRCPQVGAI